MKTDIFRKTLSSIYDGIFSENSLPLMIFAKSSVIIVWKGAKYALDILSQKS